MTTGPVWPFPTKSLKQERRTDQGWDLQYPGIIPVPVFAVESGTLRNAGPDPNGFGPGYPLLVLDHPVAGGSAVYYGHTYTNKVLVGRHVMKGTPIGMTGGPHSGGNAYADSNWLEIGFWSNGPIGNGAAMRAWITGAPGVGATIGANSPANTGVGANIPTNFSGPGINFGLPGQGGCKAPGGGIINFIPGIGQAVTAAEMLGYITCLLTDPHLWLRIAEVTVGIILLAVGLNALLKETTGTSPVQVVGKVTGTGTKLAAVM